MNYSDLPRETLEQMLRQTQAELKHEMHESNILAVQLVRQKKAFRNALKLISILIKETYRG